MANAEALHAAVEVRQAQGLWADLRIINAGVKPVRMPKPANYQPAEGWAYSPAAYDVAVLLSFHFLEMKLYAAGGALVARKPVRARADHIVEMPLELQPGSQLRIAIPLYEFYELTSGADYALELAYGDQNLWVHAKSQFHCP